MATKAIHLELVSDLTKMFLNALKDLYLGEENAIRFCQITAKISSKLGILRQIGEFLSHPENQAKITDFASNQGIS